MSHVMRCCDRDALLMCALHDAPLWSLAWIFALLFLLFVVVPPPVFGDGAWYTMGSANKSVKSWPPEL